MKFYINRRPVNGPWGGGNMFVKAFGEHLKRPGLDIEHLLHATTQAVPDVVLLVGLDNDGYDIGAEQAVMYKMYMKPDCQLVLRVNECDARKGTDFMDQKLLALSHHIDATVFVSKWMQEYFVEKGWGCEKQAVITNGVDLEVFTNATPKLNNGKVNIVAHHWSDNRMKGADVYEKLDELVGRHPNRFTFTYIGRHQCDFKHTKVIKPLSGKALGTELGKYDAYVSASRFDPGPNHVLEALSCGLPTLVHADGGGCVEFAGKSHTYLAWEELQHWLMNWPTDRVWSNEWIVQSDNPVRPWAACIQEYIDFLEATWQNRST